MRYSDSYVPVGCSFIDYIEIFATERKKIELIYVDEANDPISVMTTLKTWETKDKVEYLVTVDGLLIRLDRVISIGGVSNDGRCIVR